MRPRTLAPTAAVLCVLAAAVPALAAGGPADVPIPWNPVDGAAKGDWAQYTVSDPALPSERLPGERFTVREAEGGAVVVVDSSGETFRYRTGDEGRSALAFLRGFFGEARDELLAGLESLTASKDQVEFGGKTHEGVRIEASILSKVPAGPGEPPNEMRSQFKIWIAPGIRAAGIVRAEARVDYLGGTHRGVLTLEAHGTAAETPPVPGSGAKKGAEQATGESKPETPAPPK